MKIKNLIHKLMYIGTIGLSIFLLLIVITFSWIDYEIKSQCLIAKNEYGGECVEASIKLLDDERKDFRSRNNAIWVLSQLGDRRALPTLEKYYTGNIPPREPLNKTISQYELRKAIHFTRDEANIAAFFWRNNFINE